MEMRVHHSVKAPRAVQDIEREALLWANRNRVDNRGFWVVGFKPPLVIVQVKYVRFLHAAVYQPNF